MKSERARGPRSRSRLLAAALTGAAVLLAATGLFVRPASAQVTVKMATLVPEGSSWHLILKEAAEKWKKISNGRVNVILFAGGVAGDDPDVVRKMRLGTLQAGVLTAVGVAEVDKSVYALGVPMMYASYDEVYAVLEKMRPRLEASMEKQGFIVLNWADGGWVHFFTQKPVATPDDLKKLKLFTWAGDSDSLEISKAAGFNSVPLPSTEIATALQTGLVTAVPLPPQVAVITQYFNYAKNMTDMEWQLLLGATVISKSVWEKIPADLHAPLLEAMREAGRRLQTEIRNSGQRDVEAMKKRGLTVVPVDAKTREAWVKLAESVYPKIRGRIVPADAFDEALKYRDEYRKRTGGVK
jgi:TRAP-type C4-dicarboxylate transport system substrate-binding protein